MSTPLDNSNEIEAFGKFINTSTELHSQEKGEGQRSMHIPLKQEQKGSKSNLTIKDLSFMATNRYEDRSLTQKWVSKYFKKNNGVKFDNRNSI